MHVAFGKSRSHRSLRAIEAKLDELKILAAQPLIRGLRDGPPVSHLQEAEFKVFSQFGDDGIIQYLIHRLAPLPDSFVEFGTEDYRESNTRFLLVNNNWRGLVLDSSARAIASIKADVISWRHTLKSARALIDRDNINALLQENGCAGELGLLSIDIDGNDYWVWENLNVVEPVIVIVEYNSIFGPDLVVTIPYDPQFVRHRAHYSGQFWGASLRALASLGERKGYGLVGCNRAGNNAYFVRRNKIEVDELPVPSVEEAFVDARFRDAKDKRGNFTYLTGPERFRAIAEMSVYDIQQEKVVPLASLAGASHLP